MRSGCAALGIALATLSISGTTLKSTDNAPVVLTRLPAGGIQPEAVLDRRGTLHALYFAGEPLAGDLFYVRSVNFGQSFSRPVRVNSQPGSAIATGTIRGGQLAIGRDGRVHVAWNGSDAALPRGLSNPASGKAEAPFLYARSDPMGAAFEPQRNLTTRSYGIDGGGSIAADVNGNVYAAWHSLGVGGGDGEDHRLVWIARSTDDGGHFTPEEPAWREPTGACGCCGLRMLAGPSNILYVLYRSATAMTHRDIYLLESSDQGRTFRGSRVHPWEIGACPMSSMSLASSQSNVLGAWETAGQVYFGTIDEESARVPRPIPAPGETGTRKHPRLATGANGDVLLVWTEGTGWSRGGSLAWQAFDSAGRATIVRGTAAGIPTWSFAAPIARPDGRFIVLY